MALTTENGSTSQPPRSDDMVKPPPRGSELQDAFLNRARASKVPVTVFLVNGVKLQGVVTWFDSFSLLLARGPDAQLLYKHAVSTIIPVEPLQLYEQEDQSGGADRAPGRPQVATRRG